MKEDYEGVLWQVFTEEEGKESKKRLSNVIHEIAKALYSKDESQIIKAQDAIDVYSNLHENMNELDRYMLHKMRLDINELKK